MEKFIVYLCFVSFTLINYACKEQNHSLNNIDSRTSMITIDIYKNTIDVGLSLIYIGDKSTILLKSNGLQSLNVEAIPPPPPELDTSKNEKKIHQPIETELLQLKKESTIEIDRLLEAFGEADFSDVINGIKTEEGIGIKVNIVLADGKIKNFTLINGTTAPQNVLLKYIFEQAAQQSRLNKAQLKLYLD